MPKSPTSKIQALIKEPLLHFLLAGALLFLLHGLVNRDAPRPSQVVRVTAQEIDWLRETWARQWHRQPDPAELRDLISGYLKETLLAREAEELGLARDDVVIRRRLAQKMEFIVQDTARLGDDDEAALRRFHDANRSRYQTPPQVAFRQIFFRSEAAARQGLAELERRGADRIGDPSTLPREVPLSDAQAVASQFGPAFSRAVVAIESDGWTGPVASAYGVHLVKVTGRQAAQEQAFESARPGVLADWQREQQDKAARQYLAGLARKYEIVADDNIRALVDQALETAR